jgi:hypothetical protein
MTFAQTKEQLSTLLSDEDNKVISLAGKWGTGNLIDDLRKNGSLAEGTLYVSLFGLKTIDQIKARLIQEATPLSGASEGIAEGIKQLAKAGWKAASEQFKAIAALSDVNLLVMAPIMLREKIIIVDDIERKHADLGMDELLGFIDDYSNRHSSRFVLVLNDDRLELSQKESWQTLNEKVVDRGLKLVTSPEEAFDIAAIKYNLPYQEALKKSSTICALTNIRIIRQVIKVANLILGQGAVDEAVVTRVVPSIVLFSAIHYRGLVDGPNMTFALEIGRNINWEAHEREKKGELTENDLRAKRWRSLMYELGIRFCDAFEPILVEFLDSGLLHSAQIKEIMLSYDREHEALAVRNRVQTFLFDVVWNHFRSESQLLAEASEFPGIAETLDPYLASQLLDALSQLDDGAPIAQEVLDAWIASFRERKQTVEHIDLYGRGRPLHPEIEKVILAGVNKTDPPTLDALVEAVHVIQQGGWGAKEEVALRNARVNDFETVIRTLDFNQLPPFMHQMINMHANKTTYDKHFAPAIEHFIDACRSITVDPASPRLAKLLKVLISNSTITL